MGCIIQSLITCTSTDLALLNFAPSSVVERGVLWWLVVRGVWYNQREQRERERVHHMVAPFPLHATGKIVWLRENVSFVTRMRQSPQPLIDVGDVWVINPSPWQAHLANIQILCQYESLWHFPQKSSNKTLWAIIRSHRNVICPLELWPSLYKRVGCRVTTTGTGIRINKIVTFSVSHTFNDE